MIKRIYDDSGGHSIREVEAEPECGKDFCDDCGDCLVCYPDGWDDHAHSWIQYGEDPPHVHDLNPIGRYCISCGFDPAVREQMRKIDADAAAEEG